ncbi:MAG: hypothetical protein SFU56_04425 [Capsulimonadales bacterium]|nr:hypothetical protein [Capsulimonadales bacterium]
MSNERKTRSEKDEPSVAIPQVTLHLTPDEADAMLSILLHVANLPDVSGEMTERLLCRVADLQRQLARPEKAPGRKRAVSRGSFPVPV